MTVDWQDTKNGLQREFDSSQVSWKPQVTTKGKQKEPIVKNGQRVAGCVAHIDARDVMERLDDVVGAENWQDSYELLPDRAHVQCTITINGVSKTDVGESNEGGFADPIKSAYSDAFKRAAVKWGIGRHLYSMDMQWLPFDGYKVVSSAPQAKKPSPKKPAAKKPSQTAAISEYGLGDEVMVSGKNDEKLGVVAGYDGQKIIVRVDGKEFPISKDRLKIVQPVTEKPALFPNEKLAKASNGAYD